MNRSTYPALNVAAKRVRVSCVFLPNGTSAPTVASQVGVTSVARTAVGLFTLTLQDKYVALDSWAVTPMLNAAADTQAELYDDDIASDGTVKVRIKTAGSDADVAANANNRICVVLWLKATTSD